MAVHLKSGEVLKADMKGSDIIDLQIALRALGYLYCGIDGIFGSGTEEAVRALQYDLLYNTGESSSEDHPGGAPVAMASFNADGAGGQLVTEVNGRCDARLAQAINALLACDQIGLVPEAADPEAENAKAIHDILHVDVLAKGVPQVPPPFVLAIARQESGGIHYRTLSDDSYLMVGLDHDDTEHTERITSRGYGIGQYTLFHQPPEKHEMQNLSIPVKNVSDVAKVLMNKFQYFIIGDTPNTRADDRIAEHGDIPLRICKYEKSDALYMQDCKTCAAQKRVNITQGMPCYPGATMTYQPTEYYASANYTGVPDAASFPCDWPYAVRRYNGIGVDSYHYQCRVLLNLLKQA